MKTVVFDALTKSPGSNSAPNSLGSLLFAVCFLLMTYSSVAAIYRSKGDPGAVKKERHKIAILALATALNALLSFPVTTVVDYVVFSIIIWAVAGLTTAAGCYLIFFATPATNGATVPL